MITLATFRTGSFVRRHYNDGYPDSVTVLRYMVCMDRNEQLSRRCA